MFQSTRRTLPAGVLFAGFLPALTCAESWRLLKPSNTGIPGESILTVARDPQDRLWVAARWPFWSDGGVGIYNGEFWETYANWDSHFPSQWAYDIAFDAAGVAWIGTDAGVARFAAGAFTVYDTANSPLAFNDIENIAVDQSGHAWIGAVGPFGFSGSLHEFDGTTWTQHLPGAVPFGLFVDRDNHIWVDGGGVSGVARYDGQTWQTVAAPAGHIFTHYAQAPDGTIWAAGSAVARFNGVQFEMVRNESIRDIAIDTRGRVFIGSLGGWVDVFENNAWSRFAVVDDWVMSIIPHDHDHIWIASAATLHHFDADGRRLESFNSYNTGLPDYFVDEFYRDRDNVIWVTTGEAGASRFEEPVWRNFGNHNWGSENWPFIGSEPCDAVFQQPDGTYWLMGNGVARGDLQNWDLWNWENSNLGGAQFGSAAQDGNGQIWFGSDGYGVARFNGGGVFDWRAFSEGFHASNEMALDTAGNLWIATQVGLQRYDGANWTRFDETNSPFPIGRFRAVAAAPDGSIWVTSVAEVGRFDGANWQIFTEDNSPLPGPTPADVTVRSDGLVAITASQGALLPYYGGVALIDGDDWTVYTPQNSPMQHWQVGAVEFDGHGDLWISTLSEGVAILQFDRPGLVGDLNCDGVVSVSDIGPFVTALTDPAGYAAAFPDCAILNGDVNADGAVSVSDIGGFVALLSGS